MDGGWELRPNEPRNRSLYLMAQEAAEDFKPRRETGFLEPHGGAHRPQCGGGLRGMDAGMLGVKVRDAELKRSVCSTTAVQTLPKASLQTGALPFREGEKEKRRKGRRNRRKERNMGIALIISPG